MTDKDKLAEEILNAELLGHYMTKFGSLESASSVLRTFRSFNIWKAILKAMQAYHEAKMKEEKAKKFYDKNTCVVCHQNYVDSANGFDTCDYCLNRI